MGLICNSCIGRECVFTYTKNSAMGISVLMLNLLSLLPKGITKRLVHGQALVRNPFSLGVRVFVSDCDDDVLLVRHSYLPGWYLPGGGVDAGEIMADAARRELHEETGIIAKSDPHLLGVYLNREAFGRNHIGFYRIDRWERGEGYLKANEEIVEARFFKLNNLPEDTTPATMRRLSELSDDTLPLLPEAAAHGGYW